MNRKPLLSVIMASYNSESYIHDAICSIVHQEFTEWELIVCDGGSTDNTIAIVNSFPNGRIRLISSLDKGLYHARNKGILSAKGVYIAFLNSDDSYCYQAFTKIADAANTCNSDVIVFNMDQVLSNGEVLPYPYFNKKHVERVSRNWYLPDQSTIIRKDCISQVGLYSMEYKIVGDWEFWQRCIKAELKFRYYNLTIAQFHFREDSLTFDTNLINVRFREKIRLYWQYNGFVFNREVFVLIKRYIILHIKGILR